MKKIVIGLILGSSIVATHSNCAGDYPVQLPVQPPMIATAPYACTTNTTHSFCDDTKPHVWLTSQKVRSRTSKETEYADLRSFNEYFLELIQQKKEGEKRAEQRHEQPRISPCCCLSVIASVFFHDTLRRRDPNLLPFARPH